MKTSKVKAKVERGLKAAAKLRAMEDASAWLQTFTGRAVTPLAFMGDQVDFKDIAHALANQCRFIGHTHRFYSVAEHSFLVAKVAEDMMRQVGYGGTAFRCGALYALLHDASEAYLGDLPAPLKRHPAFADYRAIEKEVQEVIEMRLIGATLTAYSDRLINGLRYSRSLASIVQDADLTVLKFEAARLMLNPPKSWGLPETTPWQSFPALAQWSPGMEPRVAWDRFMDHAVLTARGVGIDLGV